MTRCRPSSLSNRTHQFYAIYYMFRMRRDSVLQQLRTSRTTLCCPTSVRPGSLITHIVTPPLRRRSTLVAVLALLEEPGGSPVWEECRPGHSSHLAKCPRFVCYQTSRPPAENPVRLIPFRSPSPALVPSPRVYKDRSDFYNPTASSRIIPPHPLHPSSFVPFTSTPPSPPATTATTSSPLLTLYYHELSPQPRRVPFIARSVIYRRTSSPTPRADNHLLQTSRCI